MPAAACLCIKHTVRHILSNTRILDFARTFLVSFPATVMHLVQSQCRWMGLSQVIKEDEEIPFFFCLNSFISPLILPAVSSSD